MDAYTLVFGAIPAGHVCALPPFFFIFPLCVNYHQTPALWLNYVPVNSC